MAVLASDEREATRRRATSTRDDGLLRRQWPGALPCLSMVDCLFVRVSEQTAFAFSFHARVSASTRPHVGIVDTAAEQSEKKQFTLAFFADSRNANDPSACIYI